MPRRPTPQPSAPRPRPRRSLRWPAAASTALLILLYLANLPFYAGGPLGPHAIWRMEHGRLRITATPTPRRESFWLNGNTEGLRFRPQWSFAAHNDWMINLPLWLPLAAAATLTFWTFRARRPTPGHCPRCNYQLNAATTTCPECGPPP